MIRTHVMLDGLHVTGHARQLSQRWAARGLVNAVDPAGQAAWLAREDGQALTEAQVDDAAAVARTFGVELRDRVGSAFVPANDLDALRDRLAYEFKSRFATALVFGLPALGLHYGAGLLTTTSDGPRAMLYPWAFEWLLVGWACLAAGWPMLWNGLLAAVHLRATSDLLLTLIVAATLLPGLAGIAAIIVTGDTWLGIGPADGPMLHVPLCAVMLSCLQRWRFHRAARALAGRGDWMPPAVNRMAGLWVALSVVAWAWQGREMGLAIALLWPPLVALGAINPWSPGASMLLPVLGFASVLLVGPEALQLPVRGVAVEIAAGFGLMMTGVFVAGWGALSRKRRGVG